MIDDTYESVVRQETCSIAAVRRVAAMLDLEPDEWSEGDILPRGWQFILLGADTRRSAIRGDGFPGLGVPLPELELPRLMLGARTVRFNGDIRIGTTVRRESRIRDLKRKETANGPIAIVTIAHELSQPGHAMPAVVETQTYLLLGEGPSERKGAAPGTTAPPSHSRTVVPDETLLFQYSALGFNSHRIHLDREWAREREGFPDLVVNGGLATLLLTEFLRTELGQEIESLSARHTAPLFCGRPVTLGADRKDVGWTLRALDDAGRTALEIEVETT